MTPIAISIENDPRWQALLCERDDLRRQLNMALNRVHEVEIRALEADRVAKELT